MALAVLFPFLTSGCTRARPARSQPPRRTYPTVPVDLHGAVDGQDDPAAVQPQAGGLDVNSCGERATPLPRRSGPTPPPCPTPAPRPTGADHPGIQATQPPAAASHFRLYHFRFRTSLASIGRGAPPGGRGLESTGAATRRGRGAPPGGRGLKGARSALSPPFQDAGDGGGCSGWLR